MEVIFEKYVELSNFYNEIYQDIKQENFELAHSKLESLSVSQQTEVFYIYKNIISDSEKKYVDIINRCIEGIKKYPFSSKLYYQLYKSQFAIKEYSKGVVSLAYACRYCEDSDQKLKYTDEIKEIFLKLDLYPGIENVLEQTKLILGEGDERAFPIDKDLKSWVGRTLVDSYGREYLTNLVKGYFVNEIDENTRFFFKTETLEGKYHKYFKLKVDQETILPLSIKNEEDIVVKKNSKEELILNKENIEHQRFNYIRLNKGTYTFKSKSDFFVGTPVIIENPEKNKIVLTIFIDGLSQLFIEEHGLDELMPETASYFENAYKNQNCYTTGDWTYPSAASLFTRKSTLNHKVYHPNINKYVNDGNDMFTSQLREAGFYTAQINNNWRITPSSGYVEGFNRILYQNYRGGFGAGEVLTEAKEYLNAFKGINQYLWIEIDDLHDIADGFNYDLSQQAALYLEDRVKNKKEAVSVYTTKTEDRIIRYKNQLKRIDMYLADFYQHLERNYANSEIYISIISDHGQGFIVSDEEFLHEGRRKIPFLLKGPNIEKGTSNEMMSLLDIFPNMAKLLGINPKKLHESVILKDFEGTGRDFAVTETLHPDNPYRLVITKGNYIIRMHTVENVDNIGLINFEKLNIVVLDKITMQDITEQVPHVVEWLLNYLESKIHYSNIKITED